MPRSAPREFHAARALAVLFLLFVGLLAVLVVLRRQEFPDGTIVLQERTFAAEDLNPNLREVVSGAILGETKMDDVAAQLDEPTAMVAGETLTVWIYTRRKRVVEERALFGLLTVDRSTVTNTATEPVGVRDGIVVHTIDRGSTDRIASEEVEALWIRYQGRVPGSAPASDEPPEPLEAGH